MKTAIYVLLTQAIKDLAEISDRVTNTENHGELSTAELALYKRLIIDMNNILKDELGTAINEDIIKEKLERIKPFLD